MPTGNEPTLDEMRNEVIVAAVRLYLSKNTEESDRLYEEARYWLNLLWLNRNTTILKNELNETEATE